jgi:hypothetical protein
MTEEQQKKEIQQLFPLFPKLQEITKNMDSLSRVKLATIFLQWSIFERTGIDYDLDSFFRFAKRFLDE